MLEVEVKLFGSGAVNPFTGEFFEVRHEAGLEFCGVSSSTDGGFQCTVVSAVDVVVDGGRSFPKNVFHAITESPPFSDEWFDDGEASAAASARSVAVTGVWRQELHDFDLILLGVRLTTIFSWP